MLGRGAIHPLEKIAKLYQERMKVRVDFIRGLWAEVCKDEIPKPDAAYRRGFVDGEFHCAKAKAWDEISTHVDVYRDLILEKIKNSAPVTVDSDEAGYWNHELKALTEATEVATGDRIIN